MDIFGALFAFAGIAFLIILIALIPMTLSLYGLYVMAKRQGITDAWLSFVPFGNLYIMGELIGKRLHWFPYGKSGGYKLLIINVIGFVASFIPVLGALTTIVLIGFFFVINHWLFEKYSDKAIILSIINVLSGGLSGLFTVFVLRNKKTRY